ncbi:MAG: glycosyltransferase [Actinomycetota bacterium]|nr:glycosyltransferase [Actinomycetota bacterium]
MRLAMISEHASPLAALGGEDSGGQNVYVAELARRLAAMGHRVDVFTRRDSTLLPTVVPFERGVRVVNLPAGPVESVPKDELFPFMAEFRDTFYQFVREVPTAYDLVHANFWMSGWVACEAKRTSGYRSPRPFML